MPTHVILGAGLAGGTAAATLRDEGFEGRIVLIGEEPRAPYERPPLSKEYLRGEEADPLFVRPPGWFGEHEVETRFGERARAVDAADRTVVLDSGDRIGFDALLVATGSRNRRLAVEGADVPGVFQLRTLEDADRIRAAAAGAARAVLVGAGFIGCEAAASLRSLGLEVAVVEFFATPLQRVLGAELGGVIEGLHRDHGCEMVLGEAVERFEGTDRFEAVITQGGRRVEGDFAVVGVGVEPATEILESSGVLLDGGVLVDAALRTNVPGILAAGDVARHDHPRFGPIRVEHYDNAIKMGQAAARNMLGRDEIFDDPHWFWSDQYDAQIQMSGFATGWDRLVYRGDVDERRFAAFMLQEGVLVSAFSMNWPRDVRRAKALIAAGARPDPELLTDPEVDLRRLVPGEAVERA
ncbi:MAG TPA: FAD-dependent oxidoreductase [Actinomycetota bacterium]|nr:FAD-dependent oxidoreductase [Actinomycetota bacterium]